VKYGFIRQQEKAYPVIVLCKVMEVSRSGYYKHIQKLKLQIISPDFELISKVKEIHKKVRGKYGTRRMAAQLSIEGYLVGRSRARSLMRKANVSFYTKKRFKRTTDSKHKMPVSPNVLNREFQVFAPNKVWCSDITYLWTKQGWVYLAAIIDLFSRKVVGWQVDDHMKTSLVTDALSMAYFRRKPKPGLIHHSDRGSQYASNGYQQLMREYQMTGSMSRKGNCWDNAVAESFFRSLKTERTDDSSYHTKEEARIDVIEYIEMFYNSQRLHSTLGYNMPNKFESEQNSNIS